MPPDPFENEFIMFMHYIQDVMRMHEKLQKFETFSDEECILWGISEEQNSKEIKDLRKPKNRIKCKQLKKKGDRAFSQNSFKKALKIYNEAVLEAPWEKGTGKSII